MLRSFIKKNLKVLLMNIIQDKKELTEKFMITLKKFLMIKTNLYTELVIQIGDMNYWKDKTLEEKKKMVGVFEKQLELSQKFYPNFKIANATVHLDESSPHIHVVGVCSSNEELSLKNFPEKKRKKKNGLKNYVSQNEVFTQNNMKEFHQFF